MKPLSSPQKEQAAQLIAEGRYEYGEIAEKVGVERTTIHRWRKDQKFAARVDDVRREFSEAAKGLAIRRKEYRLGVLNNIHSRLLTLLDQRAQDAGTSKAAGGDQGLIVRQWKVSGETTVPEYVFDRAVLQELRAVQEQAAKELGQLVEKHEHKIGGLKDLSDDELEAILTDLDDAPEVEAEGQAGDRAPEEAQG